MKARFFVPETVQTSAVDCGPAALKSLLEGFGISASYGRLREACQTGLDGTSIDTIELVAREVGLDAQQVMLPPDYLAIDDTALPAVVVIRMPTGMTHFIVVWRKLGPFFQIMDPASGRRWVRVRDLLSSVYVHRQPVPAAGWREWAASQAAMRVLRRRIVAVAGQRFAGDAIARVLRDEAWLPLARLDAATRLVETLVRTGAVRRGEEAERLLDALGTDEIPAPFWPVTAAAGGENVILRGAVLIRIGAGSGTGILTATGTNPELAAAVREPPVRPLARVLALLSPATRAALPLAALGAAVLGLSPVAEGLLFRSMYDLVGDVGLPQERLAILGAFALFAAFLLALDYAVTSRAVVWGHELEARFATALFGTLSTLRNDYFGSRLISDLAERSHAIAELRSLPLLLARVVRGGATFVITWAALFYLMPQAAVTLVLGGLALIAIALAFQPLFAEIDLRARTHTGGLTRFYLDALAGIGAIHAHCAERSVRREHESLMTDWVRALRRQIAAAVSQTTILAAAGFGLTAVLIRRYLGSVEDPAGVLLIAYWALNLPLVAADLAQQLQIWASQRSVVLRLIEPLDAPRERAEGRAQRAEGHHPSDVVAGRPSALCPPPSALRGVTITFDHASFSASGHAILTDVDLVIPAGTRVGIVGSSGAGKSTLVGALLGFMQPSSGAVRLEGADDGGISMAALRRQTAWVDPAIQLFNAPMEENIRYSSGAEDVARLPFALREAELYEVLQRISDSQMPLGEGGGLLSGGEGQRVRLARALMQPAPWLVILDEAFRGMDRTLREELRQRCRRLWSEATFLYVTHDVEETLDCDRVLVMQSGQVVEYDTPEVLVARGDSIYNRMRDSNRRMREEVWGSPVWRRLELRDGHLCDGQLVEGQR